MNLHTLLFNFILNIQYSEEYTRTLRDLLQNGGDISSDPFHPTHLCGVCYDIFVCC